MLLIPRLRRLSQEDYGEFGFNLNYITNTGPDKATK